MKKYIKILVCTSLFFIFLLSPFTSLRAQVKWHTIEEAASEKIGTKLYFIDFKYYYPVKFNAEGTNTFVWFGKTYNPASAGRNRTHEFAKGVQGYPTFNLFTADGKLFQSIPGYVAAKDFTVILWYLASGDYNRYSYEQYQKIFDKDIRPTMEKALKNL